MKPEKESVDYPEVNNRIKQLRRALNLNQKEFGELLDMDQANYSRIETKVYNVNWGVVTKLVYSLNVNPMWLFFAEGEMIRRAQKEAGPSIIGSSQVGDYMVINLKVPVPAK